MSTQPIMAISSGSRPARMCGTTNQRSTPSAQTIPASERKPCQPATSASAMTKTAPSTSSGTRRAKSTITNGATPRSAAVGTYETITRSPGRYSTIPGVSRSGSSSVVISSPLSDPLKTSSWTILRGVRPGAAVGSVLTRTTRASRSSSPAESSAPGGGVREGAVHHNTSSTATRISQPASAR